MSSTERPRIVVAERVSPSAMERLAAAGEVVIPEARDETALMEAVAEADALVVRTYSQVTAKVAKAAKEAQKATRQVGLPIAAPTIGCFHHLHLPRVRYREGRFSQYSLSTLSSKTTISYYSFEALESQFRL